MNYFSSLHLVVYGFLLLTLVVGLYAGRNVKTFKDYATANRSLGTGVLTVTLLATLIESNHLERPGFMYLVGPLMGNTSVPFQAIACMLIAIYLSSKFGRFTGCFTMAEIMGKLYGNGARKITAAITLVIAIFIIAAQMSFLGKTLAPFLGLSFFQTVLFAGGFVIFYATLGGMRAVALTDFLQFTAITVVLILLSHTLIHKAGGMQAFLAQMPDFTLSTSSIYKSKTLCTIDRFSTSLFYGFYGCGLLAPPVIQRMLMARSSRQIKSMLFSAAYFIPLLWGSLTIVAIGARIFFPDLPRSEVLPHLIQNSFSLPLQGCVATGIFAVVLSTIDSFLHASATTFVHDFWFINTPNATTKLRAIRFTTIALGVLALCVATIIKKNLYLNYAGMVVSALLLVPFLVGITGLATCSRDFWLSIISSFTIECLGTILLIKHGDGWYSPYNTLLALGAMLTGLLVQLVAHYQRNRGFVRLHTNNQQIVWQFSWSKLLSALGQFIPTPRHINAFLNKNIFVEKESFLLAFFLSSSYLLPSFMWLEHSAHASLNLQFAIKGLGVLLCTGLLSVTLWPRQLKARLLPSFWFFTVVYCLPFSAGFFFLLDHGSFSSIATLLITIMLLNAVMDWRAFIAAILFGGGAAVACYCYLDLPIVFDFTFNEGVIILSALVFALLIGIIFVRKTAQHNAETLQEKNTFANFISHELGNHLAVMGYGTMLKGFLTQCVQKKNKADTKAYACDLSSQQYQQLQGIANDLLSEQKHVKHIIKTYNNLLREGVGEGLPLASLATIAQRGCDAIGKDLRANTKINVVAEPDFERSLPADVFQYVVYNLVKNAIVHGHATEITVRIDGNRHTLSVQDNGKGIPIPMLPRLFQLYHTGNTKKGTGVGLAFVQRSVLSIGGDLQLTQNKQTGDPYTTFKITFLL